ncbi:MAG: hormogonium polysaccharide biosynthesis glycosyltransferase HpsE [Microcoleaceae cyanobacterium MO_207.B10]|nr:hormogonium polysaccharide biosynthesis glycosyltransferase HpsE [Microcoleaceae cyanobacterium MO_207.B10]
MTDFTVAIPTYNGAERLPLVLDKLRAQVGIEELSLEVIIVDNNSKDNTKQIIEEYQKKWSQKLRLKYYCEAEKGAIATSTKSIQEANYLLIDEIKATLKDYQQKWGKELPLTYAFEGKQGADFARRKAVQEAKSPLIGFLDDDNLPEPNWIAAAYEFAHKYPKAGAYASQIHGDFAGELPPNFNRIKPFFAITERGDKPLLYKPAKRVIPPSAGLVIRREAWLKSVPERSILSGRVPGSMLTGEDTEAISYIQKAGWEIWYNPAMEVIHKIPKHRLEKDYLIRFFRGIGLSRYVTRMLGVKPWLKPLALLAYMANDTRKIIRHLIKYGSQLETDVVAACELELYINSFKSPFYLWKNGYLTKVKPNHNTKVEPEADFCSNDII